MTLVETSELMALIAEEHPKFLDTPDPERRLGLWAEAFRDAPYDLAAFAIKRMLIESPFAPKLSDVVQRIKELIRPEGDSAIEAWNTLSKAASRASVVTREEFAALPPEVQRFCGSLNGLRSLGMMDEDVFHSVTRGQFLKVYDGMRRSRETVELMPPQLKALVHSMAKPLPEAPAEQRHIPEKAGAHPEAPPVVPAVPSVRKEYKPLSEAEFEKRRQELKTKLLEAQGKDSKT